MAANEMFGNLSIREDISKQPIQAIGTTDPAFLKSKVSSQNHRETQLDQKER